MSQRLAQVVVANDRILKVTTLLAALIVPILTVAFLMLYLFPGRSGLLFAWPVKPNMSAMMLGATYLGGAYFFTRVVQSKHWHTVRLGFWPVTAFAGILGIATILHWDKFTPGHISFILWAILYFTLPFVIPLVWYRNQQANREFVSPAERMLPKGLRIILGAIGAVMALASAILLIFPEWMIPIWPWALTPLTARILAAMFILPGLVALGVARDGHLSSAQHVFGAQVISIIFILLAMVIARADIDWNSLGIYTFIGGLLLVLVLILWTAAWDRRLAGGKPALGERSE